MDTSGLSVDTGVRSFDLVVLGGGPAGTSGAGTAALYGHSVALIEMERQIGGAGVLTGTIPSKALRETALALSGWRTRKLHGVDLSLRREATIADFTFHQQQVSDSESCYLSERLSAMSVERFHGKACFVDPHTIRVSSGKGEPDVLVRAQKILIATGSTPYRPPEFPFDDNHVHDSDELLRITELPKKLVIVGAGVIGSEYACTFATLGVEVVLIDGRDRLMPFLDGEISTALATAMSKIGVQFRWNEQVQVCNILDRGKIELTLSSGTCIACDSVLVCSGRSSNTGDLNLAAANILPGKRGILQVDNFYRTTTEHIYAAGDVIGAPALAATSMEQARIAVAHAFNIAAKSQLTSILPTGIYTIPEVSMVGETEESLKAKCVAYVVGRAYYADNPRGRIIGDDTGFLKLLFRQDDMRLLGVHIMGEQATEVIHAGLLALVAESGAELFNRVCFNYPTLGDLYKTATYDAIVKLTAHEHIKASPP